MHLHEINTTKKLHQLSFSSHTSKRGSKRTFLCLPKYPDVPNTFPHTSHSWPLSLFVLLFRRRFLLLLERSLSSDEEGVGGASSDSGDCGEDGEEARE